MNNPDHFSVDIEEERDWLNAEKARKGLSWTALSALVGLPSGTLSVFGTGRYEGNNERVARQVFKYRQTLATQVERQEGLLIDPGYFETPTSRRLTGLLVEAHTGRITVGATGPGTGKTMTMKEYQASASNVWVATMRQTTKTVNAMMGRVLRALGVDSKAGWGAQLSDMVMESVRGRRGLLVIDEANHLTIEAFEEIRAWHDETRVGVCLLGNEELLMRIEGGPRRDAFARLNSRIAQRHIQNLPLAADVEAFCESWGLQDSGIRSLLTRIAMTPGAGGLRECRQIVEQASMLAASEGRALSLADIKDAQSVRATRSIREAA